MELCTRCSTPWGERVVHILVYSCEGIPEDINDKETYKIFTLDKGTLFFEYKGKKKMVSAPAVFLLTEDAAVPPFARMSSSASLRERLGSVPVTTMLSPEKGPSALPAAS